MRAISCGTLLINDEGKILLCHVTDTRHWDIPKGIQDPGETALAAARRELREETGLAFAAARFHDLGQFAYRPDKDLHLFRVDVGRELATLEALACTSFYPHRHTGRPTPEADGFRWCTRAAVRTLCWPRMAALLLALDW
jgi:8-oxo-dGTP pyrophosphatase MutT (NUDIX family)